MELNGEVIIDAPRQKVWQALNSPTVLARCIPGCEEVRQISAAETHVRVALKMGPVRARFVGKILMDEVVEDQGCRLNFEGSGGAAGFARGQSKVTLSDRGSATCLAYSASAAIGGKLGQIGGRMIDASAKQMADQFFNALQADFVRPGDVVTPAVAAAVNGDASESNMAFSSTASKGSTAGTAHRLQLAVPSITPTAGEGIRILWFVLGAAATGFGFALAHFFSH